MNIFVRLFLVCFSVASIYTCYKGFTSMEHLTIGQGMMLASLVPLAGFCLLAANHTQKNAREAVPLMVMSIGIFLGILCMGMHGQTKEIIYLVFSVLGVATFVISLRLLTNRSVGRVQSFWM